ncbi:hypothetical protein C3Y98_04705 [Methylotenera oryzisoli]|uniref:DUF2313 domain-containing protein n=1 Tax=Methylotenera oryzisoli TaxID=2080758 RepID=A0A4Y9VSG6_9PROT|nr:putative phage tail protein [Methylotenera oryzisoli]TFW71409.1 hypothetical protein C3Y98_04705 [Methylotenera oryzisoli]
MALTAESYLQQLQALLPQGPAWPREEGALNTKLLDAWSAELARVDARIEALINEADPRVTSELLADWEALAGLPDPCVTVDQTVDQRRLALVSKLTNLGGQSRQYFINLATSMGYADATIDEYKPMNCNDNCNDALYSDNDRFYWTMNLPSDGGIFIANCQSPCDSPLQSWGDEAIECRINKYKPAHTTVIFAYP